MSGKVAVVTGAASGMGRATAYLFGDEGARVAAGDRNGSGAKTVADEISGNGGVAFGWEVDVADPDSIAAFIDATVSTYGGIDILINNAGISVPAPVAGDNWEDAWAATLAVNLTGEARMVRACLPHLLASGAGRIVNIASTEGLGATAYLSPYVAAKTGVVGLTRALAVELGRDGITVNCVCPGPIETGMTAPIPDAEKEKFARRRVPVRRYGQPEEVAHITFSLCLPAASYINGAIIPVDGGMIAQNT